MTFNIAEFTADTAYHSTVNLEKCEEESLDAYIPDVNFRKRDPRFKDQFRFKPKKKKRKHFKLEDFIYDETTDSYTCPGGQTLTIRARHAKIKTKIYRRYGAAKGACDHCRFRKRCLKTPTARIKYLEVDLGRPEGSLIGRMIEKVDTEYGKARYERRLAIVEPVFANIRTQKGLDRFTVRGKPKVNVQWNLFCIIHNMSPVQRAQFVLM